MLIKEEENTHVSRHTAFKYLNPSALWNASYPGSSSPNSRSSRRSRSWMGGERESS